MMEIIYIKTNDLKPYNKNPRYNDKAVKYVANSIKEFGFKVPMVIDKNNVVVTGHTRLKAAKELGLEEVPCVIADDLSPEQIKAFRLADNKVAEIAEWDKALLGEELDELFDFYDMNDFGFPIQIEELDEYFEGEEQIATELGERNDYVVLEFKTDEEWERAQLIFGLERVATSDKNKNVRRHGIGRVIEGKPILDKLEGIV